MCSVIKKLCLETTIKKERLTLNNKWAPKCLLKNRLNLDVLKTRNMVTETRYKIYKNTLSTTLRQCVKDYYSKLLQEQSNNVNETWKMINSIMETKTIAHTLSRYIFNDNKSLKIIRI